MARLAQEDKPFLIGQSNHLDFGFIISKVIDFD
jgi:hypothetical protein